MLYSEPKIRKAGPGLARLRRNAKFEKLRQQTEREMRDQMNGIRRDASGRMTHMHGRPIAKEG